MYARIEHDNIKPEQLKGDAVIQVKGKIAFSMITRKSTDEERKSENDRSKSKFKLQKNYYKVSIVDAETIYKDPAKPTLEEIYVNNQKIYIGKEDGIAKMNVYSTSEYPIQVCKRNDNDKTKLHNITEVGKELGKDLPVTLVFRTFSSKMGNTGLNLDAIIVEADKVVYYTGSQNMALSALGLTVVPTTVAPSDNIKMEETNVPHEELDIAEDMTGDDVPF